MMKLSDSELRLECLRLATCSVKPTESGKPNGALEVATKFYEFMRAAEIAPKARRSEKALSPSKVNDKARKTMVRVAARRGR
ncbi:hypothetical protein [Bradyrhizobium ottawaense]|uniref:hypothetical protein n=1 Tax=Bradyrhizobium ottawaense TaxID=931866 RepID=UPI0030F38123